MHVWQSWVKIEDYSVAYFDRVRSAVAHTCYVDLSGIDAASLCVSVLPLMEVLHYSASNTVTRLKYATEADLSTKIMKICTQQKFPAIR